MLGHVLEFVFVQWLHLCAWSPVLGSLALVFGINLPIIAVQVVQSVWEQYQQERETH